MDAHTHRRTMSKLLHLPLTRGVIISLLECSTTIVGDTGATSTLVFEPTCENCTVGSYGSLSVCLSVQTTGVLLASWCIPVTTYWLLFGFVGYRGHVGYIVANKTPIVETKRNSQQFDSQ